MINISPSDTMLLPLPKEPHPQELRSPPHNLSHEERKILSRALPENFLKNHKIYDIPLDLLNFPIPLSFLPQVFKLATQSTRLQEMSPRQKLFFEMFSKFCFINRKNIPLTLVQSLHEKLYGHGLFHVFKHAQSKQDVIFYANNIPSLPVSSVATLQKSLFKASLNNIEAGKCGISLAQKQFSKDEILDEIMPQLNNAQLLEALFSKKFLTQKDATDPRLIGPFLIKKKDDFLNILHTHAQQDFVPALIRLHHQKRCYPMPYISRNLKRFESDPMLLDVIEASQHRWVNQNSQRSFNEAEFIACLEKSLMQKETKNATEEKTTPKLTRKM